MASITNIALILLPLLGAPCVAKLFGINSHTAGRIGIAAVFAFTALGHFLKRDAMAGMIPAWVPLRSEIVVASGVLEALLAVLLLVPSCSRKAGIAVCVFLVLVTPINVYAALSRVDFGGHAAGPSYLIVRIPLQAVLLIWTYWFAVRQHENA